MSDKLRPLRAVRTFSYDPEPFLALYAPEDEPPTQEQFEEYVTECAVEDFDCGRDSFHILPSSEDEEAERLDFTLDALSTWEWYIEFHKVHLLGDGGAYENRQYVIEKVTPALRDVWRKFEAFTGQQFPDSFDWEFTPRVLEGWHSTGRWEDFSALVESEHQRIIWMVKEFIPAWEKEEEDEADQPDRKKIRILVRKAQELLDAWSKLP